MQRRSIKLIDLEKKKRKERNKVDNSRHHILGLSLLNLLDIKHESQLALSEGSTAVTALRILCPHNVNVKDVTYFTNVLTLGGVSATTYLLGRESKDPTN